MRRYCQAEIISWQEYCHGIAPLWNADPKSIPIINNPYRIIRYEVGEWKDRILFYPVKLVADGRDVAFTGIYNISDTATRIRGIYVREGERGKGYGHIIAEKASKLFPVSFNRTFGFYRENRVDQFMQHSSLRKVPNTEWFWSDHSKVRLQFLYRQWAETGDPAASRSFILENIDQYGFGGTNNLDRKWTSDEWDEFSRPHAHAYDDGHIDLDFD